MKTRTVNYIIILYYPFLNHSYFNFAYNCLKIFIEFGGKEWIPTALQSPKKWCLIGPPALRKLALFLFIYLLLLLKY